MSKITPFLWFKAGEMPDAIAFYTSVFKQAQVVSQNPMTAQLELLGQRFQLLNADSRWSFNESISFVIDCKDQAEVDYYWNALTEGGGAESMCGWLRDKFGLSWQVIPEVLPKYLGDPDPGRRERATQAMLQMRKIVIADLEKAAAG
jgi:predicted 3-demethylubiquinone-9 3-methyltransferase (glyoxalase superfamily)